ncbi:hypothetical protein [Neobacillus niacini]|uniref:hypothetical protein n=1 Tax=Neobacillus niacini TaxID=86668 RepID=UPI00203E8C5E|nr:hypothetical protein [Neobacillus niacini]MCM3692208.1 hypothetical protein [Neobacillus niacini]
MNLRIRDVYSNRRVFRLDDQEFLDIHIEALSEVTKSLDRNMRQLKTISQNLEVLLRDGT